mmetsp:Transcript_9712/g.26340  ORF Transcript_9712/g.26340 Transcript_9712/m.26340 type:complete len:218 (-) Transcript_9712:1881-2534(-)
MSVCCKRCQTIELFYGFLEAFVPLRRAPALLVPFTAAFSSRRAISSRIRSSFTLLLPIPSLPTTVFSSPLLACPSPAPLIASNPGGSFRPNFNARLAALLPLGRGSPGTCASLRPGSLLLLCTLLPLPLLLASSPSHSWSSSSTSHSSSSSTITLTSSLPPSAASCSWFCMPAPRAAFFLPPLLLLPRSADNTSSGLAAAAAAAATAAGWLFLEDGT